MLAAQAGAVRIRADVERKRLFGLEPDADSRGAGVDIYTAEAGRRTFARLAELAAGIIGDGFAVIVDATFIRRSLRDDFRRLARELGVPFHILLCDAPTEELRRRVRARLESGADASEADVEVLEAQLRAAELPDPAQRTRNPACRRNRSRISGTTGGASGCKLIAARQSRTRSEPLPAFPAQHTKPAARRKAVAA